LDKIDVDAKDHIAFDPDLPTRISNNRCPGLLINGKWLPDVLQSSACRILELTSVKDGSGSLLKLRYNYQQHVEAKPPYIIPWEGTVFLDENKGFLVHRFELSYVYPKFTGVAAAENELAFINNSIPFLKRSVSHHHNTPTAPTAGPEREVDEVAEYTIEPKELTESDCKLSAFGLPEPPAGLGKSRARWPMWAALAGIVCLGLAAALFLWKARRRGPSPSRKGLEER
jgi:hypothetical protein